MQGVFAKEKAKKSTVGNAMAGVAAAAKKEEKKSAKKPVNHASLALN